MKKWKSDKRTNRYLSSPSSWTTWISRGEDRVSPISCFPNHYYEYFVSISICSLLCWHSEGVTSVKRNWFLYPDGVGDISTPVLHSKFYCIGGGWNVQFWYQKWTFQPPTIQPPMFQPPYKSRLATPILQRMKFNLLFARALSVESYCLHYVFVRKRCVR